MLQHFVPSPWAYCVNLYMAKNITQMFRLNKNRTTGTYMRTAESLLCRFLVLDKYKVVVIRP